MKYQVENLREKEEKEGGNGGHVSSFARPDPVHFPLKIPAWRVPHCDALSSASWSTPPIEKEYANQ